MARYKRIGVIGLLVIGAFLCGCGAKRYHSSVCKQRGAAFNSRVETLRREARDQLTIGTKKPNVIQFFADRQFPVTFAPLGNQLVATGTIHTTGCAPSGCGTDDALIGVRVDVNEAGTVISEPVVVGMYTNCL